MLNLSGLCSLYYFMYHIYNIVVIHTWIELICRFVQKGDEQALNSLYNTYSGKMMKICLRYVPDRQIAQDLLHDGFIVILVLSALCVILKGWKAGWES